jgi:predicted lysophospholipase L1 biosynthesis ABC-type transport system permease subunit
VSQSRVDAGDGLRAENQSRQLVELKAVDESWPLFGVAEIHAEPDCGRAGLRRRRHCGRRRQTLMDRLHVKRGDLVKLGDATFRMMAVLDKSLTASRPAELGRLLDVAEGIARHRLVTTEAWSTTPIASL